MLIPKKLKHRKWHKGRRRNKGIAQTKNRVSFGSFGLKALSPGWITSRQIEAARVTINRGLGKGGRIWIRIFPDKPRTKKGNEVPMGSGKGAVEFYIADVKPGTVMFEVEGVTEEVAREAFRKAAHKLPVKAKLVSKED